MAGPKQEYVGCLTPDGAVVTATTRGWYGLDVKAKLNESVGGSARLRVIMLLALTVGLEAASNGTVGALVVPLKNALHINNIQVGLLASVSTPIGVLASLIGGSLADRVNRSRLLWITILAWSAATALSGASSGYLWLLVSRLGLAAAVAVAAPLAASLTGDFFAPHERGRIYGFLLAGEGLCTALGLEVSGMLGAISWRLGFWWLAAAGVVLAVAVAKMLPEPPRGGLGHIPVGASEIVTARQVGAGRSESCPPEKLTHAVADAVAMRQIQPHAALVLHDSPEDRSLWWAVRYVLSVRTNVVLIIGSAFGYFYFTGLGMFAMALLRGRFHIGQTTATLLMGVIGLGALFGALSSGRLADRLIGRGHLSARMTVAGAAFLIAAAFFLPVLIIQNLAIAVGFAFLAAIGLGAASPPLDAGRLDIMHSRLWGRAEAVRTTLRSAATGIAPLVFGYIATRLGGPTGDYGQSQTDLSGSSAAQPAAAVGLDHTFLLLLAPMAIGGALIVLLARRTYPRDVATAIASERAVGSATESPRSG